MLLIHEAILYGKQHYHLYFADEKKATTDRLINLPKIMQQESSRAEI
jgi:hypothetical protein